MWRAVKATDKCFGGIQVICVGDFFQVLPPVPNDLYSDAGQPAFTANVWKTAIVHKLELTDVLRTSESDLVQAVNELERGFASPQTWNLMISLGKVSS